MRLATIRGSTVTHILLPASRSGANLSRCGQLFHPHEVDTDLWFTESDGQSLPVQLAPGQRLCRRCRRYATGVEGWP